jgi:hypothetical protein
MGFQLRRCRKEPFQKTGAGPRRLTIPRYLSNDGAVRNLLKDFATILAL